ncbi:protein FAR1-RELATED SEQUENCE 5-like [Malus domestica]|uniref:protein FAR1-RELATED SEQUENCE 5-like n=1 Tax=Malus domestica TaxID=3750 RepID=UPI0010AA1F34|nr:protein FAR1-RELATED SEQUENCE 5-like [Malus domestica]
MGNKLEIELLWGKSAEDQSGAGSVELVFSTVNDELKPKFKIEFESLDEGYTFYNNYALVVGFGIRENSNKKSSNGECWLRKEFVCCKECKKMVDTNPKPNKKGRRGDARIECKAKITLNKGIGSETFTATVFNESHNHPMSKMLKEHFEDEKEKNDSFYLKMEINEGRTLGNFFWADAKSRRAYDHFGDVIMFDTTFNTNVYGMMFAPLLGVNNHGQTAKPFK